MNDDLLPWTVRDESGDSACVDSSGGEVTLECVVGEDGSSGQDMTFLSFSPNEARMLAKVLTYAAWRAEPD
jgi:hypothetical protein